MTNKMTDYVVLEVKVPLSDVNFYYTVQKERDTYGTGDSPTMYEVSIGEVAFANFDNAEILDWHDCPKLDDYLIQEWKER